MKVSSKKEILISDLCFSSARIGFNHHQINLEKIEISPDADLNMLTIVVSGSTESVRADYSVSLSNKDALRLAAELVSVISSQVD